MSNAEALFESVKLVTIQDLRLDLPAFRGYNPRNPAHFLSGIQSRD